MIRLTGKGIAKRYGATRALDGLDLDVRSGEVVGIAGPNGAGKSTLTRMLAGEETADQGTIHLMRGGQPVGEVWRHVAVVHQEPHVWPNMTVRENLVVGREGGWFGKIASPLGSSAVLDRLGIGRFADFALGDLSLAVQQRVEIARAIISEADVFLFDEPNSALTEEESQALFETMAELAADDKIVLLITHRLNDFVRSCNRVLVLRDGKIATEIGKDELTEAAIATQLTKGVAGSTHCAPTDKRRTEQFQGHPPVLRLARCTDPGRAFRNVSLDLMPGRILALAGVEGSGARELAQALGGFRPMPKTTIDRDRQPAEAAYLAASRRQTVFGNLSVGENLASRLGWKQLSRPWPFLDVGKIQQIAEEGMERYRVKAASSAHSITSLSGGNQQKVVLGALMEQNTALLVIEEPTRGVDISSKADIYDLLRAFADRGRSVVLLCTEVQEIYEAADDLIVLSRGEIVGRLARDTVASVTALASVLAQYEA